MKLFFATLAVVALLGVAPSAHAQKQPPAVDLGSAIKNLPKADRAIRPVSTTAATRFKPNGKRIVVAQLVEQLDGTAEEKANARKMLEDFFKEYETKARKLGMENDVAGAVAFCITTYYQVYKGGAKVSDTAFTGVFRQFQSALDSDEIREMPDEEKQKMYEEMILQSIFVLMPYKAAVAEGNKSEIKQIRQKAGETLGELLKTEPENISISDEGLAINKSSGDSDN